MVVPLAIGIYLYLLCLAEVHKEKRNDEKEARHAERYIFPCLFCLRHQAMYFALNEYHLAFESLTRFPVVSVLLNHYGVCPPTCTTADETCYDYPHYPD